MNEWVFRGIHIYHTEKTAPGVLVGLATITMEEK